MAFDMNYKNNAFEIAALIDRGGHAAGQPPWSERRWSPVFQLRYEPKNVIWIDGYFRETNAWTAIFKGLPPDTQLPEGNVETLFEYPSGGDNDGVRKKKSS